MKKIIVVFLILLLSGCTVNYNLKIDENAYLEDVEIIENNKKNWQSIAYQSLNYKDSIDYFIKQKIAISYRELNFGGGDYVPLLNYKTDLISNDNHLGLRLKYDFNEDTIQNSSVIHSCYIDYLKYTEETYTYFSTEKNVNCFQLFPLLETININVESKYKVVNNNADVVDSKNNIYKWVITKDDANNKPIYLTIDKTVKFDKTPKFIRFLEENILILFLVVISIGGVTTTIIIYLLNKKNNKI